MKVQMRIFTLLYKMSFKKIHCYKCCIFKILVGLKKSHLINYLISQILVHFNMLIWICAFRLQNENIKNLLKQNTKVCCTEDVKQKNRKFRSPFVKQTFRVSIKKGESPGLFRDIQNPNNKPSEIKDLELSWLKTMSYDDVEIEDMEWNEELKAFTYPCPCGDLFQITKEDLKIGEEIARCPSCSLYITVIYNMEDFTNQKSKTNIEPAKQQPVAVAWRKFRS